MPPPLTFSPVNGQPVHFREAIRAAEERDVVLPEVYYGTLQGIARQQAFTIAGLTSYDQLKAVKDSLDQWLAEGKTFKQWQREHAVKALELPTYRLENIFRTNLQGNYQAGHWEQIERAKTARPYLMYDAINDSRTRPAHRAMDGLIRPVDDPFWKTHSPPNGYRCRCGLISLTPAQANARSTKNPATGLDKAIDETAMQPDKGWAYSPRDRLAGLNKALADKRASSSPVLMQVLADKLSERQRLTDRDYLKAEGAKLLDDILGHYDNPIDQHAELLKRLREQVAMSTPAAATYLGSEAKTAQNWLEYATRLLPDTWTKACDDFGKLNVRASKAKTSRGFHATLTSPKYTIGDRVNLGAPFKIVKLETENEGFLFIDSRAQSTAVHEFCHRVQAALPDLDAIFQEEHRARTAGEELQRLKDIYPKSDYKPTEVTRRDKYIGAYFGKEYGDRGALEVMTMSMEAVLGVTDDELTLTRFTKIMNDDKELASLVVGLLLKWRPL